MADKSQVGASRGSRVAQLFSLGSIHAMRFIPHLLWLAGGAVTLFAVGSYCGHSLPYQDPTPELLAVQRGQIQTAEILAAVGVVLVVSGFALVIFRKGSRARS